MSYYSCSCSHESFLSDPYSRFADHYGWMSVARSHPIGIERLEAYEADLNFNSFIDYELCFTLHTEPRATDHGVAVG